MRERIIRNFTLFELILGIILFTVICQAASLIIFRHKLYYCMGLLLGSIVAVISAVYMSYTIGKACDNEAGAGRIITLGAIIRYVYTCIFIAVLAITDVFSPLTGFLGVMSLKLGAYMVPGVHKLLKRMGPLWIREFISEDEQRHRQMAEEYAAQEALKEAEKQAAQENQAVSN